MTFLLRLYNNVPFNIQRAIDRTGGHTMRLSYRCIEGIENPELLHLLKKITIKLHQLQWRKVKWAGAELNRRHTDFQSVAKKTQVLIKQRLVKPQKRS